MPTAPPIPLSHTHSPIHPLTHSSPLDSLLEAVTTPNADLDAIAQAHNLTRADLARIVESPEAQPLLAALRNLHAIHHEFQSHHISLTLAQTLLDAARTATNPTDKRLAATAALRALYPSSNPPQNRARSASERPPRSPSAPRRGTGSRAA